MSDSIFDTIISKNEIPMIFIGSGISKRYLNNYPNWFELLKELWNEIGIDGSIYQKAGLLKQESTEEFYVNTQIAQLLENECNKRFFEGQFKIKNFSAQDAFETEISPFKKLVSNKFTKYEYIKEKKEELDKFRKALINSKLIFTTNYDYLLESTLDDYLKNIEIFIGQNGFLRNTECYSEIYKLHGCITNPNSIILTDCDYSKFEKNSILISAKMISNLLNSPIIFMGYSLNDINIRRILKQFSNSLSQQELDKLNEKFIVVEWKQGEKELQENTHYDSDLKCVFTHIQTDNYGKIFEYIASVNQGISPAIIKKYNKVFKQLISERATNGELDKLFVTLGQEQINDIEENLTNKNFVIALGDEKFIYKIPTRLDYLNDYFSDKNEITKGLALKFIANYTPTGRLPIKKYISDIDSIECLTDNEKTKIKKRIKRCNLTYEMKKIDKKHRIEFNCLDDIQKEHFPKYKLYDIISYNIKNLDKNEVLDYIKINLSTIKESSCIRSEFSKMILFYDLNYN